MSATSWTQGIIAPLIVAGVVATATYATTRASNQDLMRLEERHESDSRLLDTRLAEVQTQLHRIEVQQAEFQGQMRSAMNLGESSER